ncbi:MAG TPA: 23S rRNA (guanosine(2251)-2'-O)-methyltransferase RlmB [Stellaceae bacterium]|nr:23S rRNA (guanosine(2251)-2'-O)-methyltransferase RlmB [Stellaceae bacterium]
MTRPASRARGGHRPHQHGAGRAAPPQHEHEPRPSGGGAWLWGRHAVLAALANPARKRLRVVATAEAAAELAALDEPVQAQILEREALAQALPAGAVHQGMALLARPLPPADLEGVIEHAGENTVLVVLDQVTDPHNVGAVLRSAAAFGAAAVIVPDRHAPEMSGVLAKAASGAVEHVPVVRVVNLARALARLKESGWWIVGLDGAAERTLASLRLSGRIALVLGAEGDGMRRLTREACDLAARLPTGGPVASLNVSNAAAAALYELAREREC